MRDLYTILGVSRSAESGEIRKAFRKLAMQFHPDRNPDPSCAERFREVNEAYKVLGNEERRVLYDRYGDVALNPNFKGFEGGAEQSWGESPFAGFEDFFNGFSSGFDGHGTQEYRGSDREDDNYFQHTSTRQNEYGTSDSYYTDNFGFGNGENDRKSRSSSSSSSYQPPQRGADIELKLTLELPEAIMGCNKRIDVRRPSRWTRGSNAGMTQETVSLLVPAGTQSNTQLRVAEKGSPGAGGGISGDLVVTVNVKPHPYLYREGYDIFLNVPLTLSEGINGAQLAVPTLHGTVRVRIPPGVVTGQKLRLRDRGGPKSTGGNGDMYLVLRLTPPDLNDPKAKEIAAALDEFYPIDGIREEMKL